MSHSACAKSYSPHICFGEEKQLYPEIRLPCTTHPPPLLEASVPLFLPLDCPSVSTHAIRPGIEAVEGRASKGGKENCLWTLAAIQGPHSLGKVLQKWGARRGICGCSQACTGWETQGQMVGL